MSMIDRMSGHKRQQAGGRNEVEWIRPRNSAILAWTKARVKAKLKVKNEPIMIGSGPNCCM